MVTSVLLVVLCQRVYSSGKRNNKRRSCTIPVQSLARDLSYKYIAGHCCRRCRFSIFPAAYMLAVSTSAKKNYPRILPNKSRLQAARDLCTGIRVLRSCYFVIEFRRRAITHCRYFAPICYLYNNNPWHYVTKIASNEFLRKFPPGIHAQSDKTL